MNYKYTCLNPIAAVGLNNLDDRYARTEDFAAADAVFVRSAKMDEMVPGANLLAVARAGAGVNNIPHAEYAKKGIVVFNTPGANANGVKELVIAAMLLASRDIVGGIEWVKANAADWTPRGTSAAPSSTARTWRTSTARATSSRSTCRRSTPRRA